MQNPSNTDRVYNFTTPEQELVLRASLLERNDAISAWERWESTTDLEGYHNDVFRLLPLLYHNLKKHNLKHPFMKRLKGVYKMFWYQNKQLLHENTIILRELKKSGIDTLVFKGAPLAILHYKNIALRPMNDVDVLVKKKDVHKSIDFFTKRGWIPQLMPIKDYLKYHNGVGFADRDGNEFDIHWHPLVESIWEEDHNDFWDNSVPLTINGFETRAFSATDLLLHTIIHGIKWNLEPPVRWIADSYYLINYSGDQIDWDRFIYLAKKYNLGLKIKKSIGYLSDVFQVKIPESTVSRINEINISKIDRIEFEYILEDPEKTHKNKFIGNLVYHTIGFREIIGKKPSINKILMFPDYLRYRYGSPDFPSFVFLFIRLFLKKMVQGVFRIFSRNNILSK